MKILRLTTLLDFGGQEKKYLSFTENPELLRHQYVFSAIGYGGNAERKLKERGFEVHVLNRNFSIRNLSNIWAVYRLIKKIRPDVVHTAAAEANFHGIIAAKLAGVKTIIGEEIGIPNHSVTAQKIFRLVYQLADNVIGVSASVKNHLVSTGEISGEKGVVIYNPVSVPETFPKVVNSKFSIVYVGRLEKVKNVATLIKAFAKVSDDSKELTLVGDGRERESLEILVGDLGISDKVHFTGFSSVPSRYLCNAQLFVLPSFSEGFGIAAVEAMFLKIPVLCTNVGGIPEFVTESKTGWLFDPLNIEKLSQKLTYICGLPDLQREKIAEDAYEYVINRFTVEKYITTLENFYGK
ncbi:MAG: glycosyltransferase [Flavobacteriales bacterium]|nr:glycosyltransferase [Flavobacteriales bacterium]